jgi:hypothetical protein
MRRLLTALLFACALTQATGRAVAATEAAAGSAEASGAGSAEASGAADPQPAPEATAQALFDEAEAAAKAGDRLRAIERYDQLTSRFPSVRNARIARLRSQQLRALQGEPEPDLRAAFDEAKANAARLGLPETTTRVRALADRAKAPALQQDLQLWLADEALRAGRPAEARAAYNALLNLETLTTNQARATVAGILRSSASFRDSIDARTRIHGTLALRGNQFDEAVATRLYDEANDHLFSLLALYASCLTLLLAALHVAAALMRRTAKLPDGFWRPSLLFPLYAFAGAGLFADSWEHGRLLPFLAGGLAVTLLLLLLRVADARRPPVGRGRFVAVMLHVATMLAALYLVFYAADLQHLMGL